jgi:hypothetical protein
MIWLRPLEVRRPAFLRFEEGASVGGADDFAGGLGPLGVECFSALRQEDGGKKATRRAAYPRQNTDHWT